ncbi:hypothetical protein [Mucilaginibacter antarcticus]|uniref:Cytochrome oxidase complex assembly protein 1 n=1 Tax=Mucilaginibacter antarcticus TaxID=1855725 RepID=A0ABW5XQ50_9SPHI
MTANLPQNKTDQYLKQKAAKKKTGNKALIIFLVFIAIAISVLAKITLTGSLSPSFSAGMPGAEDTYDIAKQFIEPTLKSSSANFQDDRYQFGNQSDSVFVIQSSVKTSDGGEKIVMPFKIVLKYNGGQIDRKKNWSLVDLSVR